MGSAQQATPMGIGSRVVLNAPKGARARGGSRARVERAQRSVVLFNNKVCSSGGGGRSGVTYISTVSLIRAILRWLYVELEVITRMILKVCLGNLASGNVGWF